MGAAPHMVQAWPVQAYPLSTLHATPVQAPTDGMCTQCFVFYLCL